MTITLVTEDEDVLVLGTEPGKPDSGYTPGHEWWFRLDERTWFCPYRDRTALEVPGDQAGGP